MSQGASRFSLFWTPWSQSTAIALANGAHEKTVLDLKSHCDLSRPTQTFELAKDMAAFANALGGTVLVGASERSDTLGRKTGRIEAFVPLTDDQALIKAATSAARDLCQPPITVEPEIIKLTPEEQSTIVDNPLQSTATLVALNVHPLVASPCGVAACDSNGKRVSDAFRFPLRFIEGTKWLRPEELAFHMNSHERRMYLLLVQLPRDRDVFVWDKGQGGLGAKRTGRIGDLDPDRMIAKLQFKDSVVHVPLTFVTAVWLDEKDVWNVDIRGAINTQQTGDPVRFVPFGSIG
jgi:hypothetical protein